MRRREARAVAIGLIAGHNIAQNSFLNETGYVVGNLLAGATLVALGKSTGSTVGEMGLVPAIDTGDVKLVAGALATFAASTLAAAAHPATRELLRDERAREESWESIRHKVLIRFPLGTAAFEEVAFRGVLPALLAKSAGVGDVVSSALFGLWHVLPTARVMRGNPLGSRANYPARVVAAGSIATVVAGLVLSSLRRRTGSVAVPWLLHSSFNITSYLGGVVAWRLDR